MMKNTFVLNLIQIIFTLVGLGLIAGGYFASPGSLTDDGFPLNTILNKPCLPFSRPTEKVTDGAK